jgi:hypothetical protein
VAVDLHGNTQLGYLHSTALRGCRSSWVSKN